MRRLLLILIALLLPWQVFATTTLYVDTDAVNPAPPTYNHLADAITYLQGYNNGVLDDDFVIECSGSTADTTAVTINTITTSSSNTLTIKQSAADKHGGVWSTSKYRLYVPSGTDSLSIDGVDNVTIAGLQIGCSQSGGGYSSVLSSNRAVLCDGLYVRVESTTEGVDGVKFSDTAGSTIRNSIIEAAVSVSHEGLYVLVETIAYNNIIIGDFSYGWRNAWDTMTVINNIVIGARDGCYYDQGGSETASGNISGDTTSMGTAVLTSAIATDIFTDPANGDYTLKSGSAAIGNGTDLSAYFTTDITGATRSAPWDIGAFAYAAATGWAGKIYGITPAKIIGVPVSNISKVGGL